MSTRSKPSRSDDRPTASPTPKPRAVRAKLTASKRSPNAGKKVVLKLKLTPKPDGGTVTFRAGKRAISGCTKLVAAAVVTCRVTYAKPGKHTIRASYTGNARFAKARSATLRIKVKA